VAVALKRLKLKKLNATNVKTVNARAVAKTVNASAKTAIANVLARIPAVRRINPAALRVRGLVARAKVLAVNKYLRAF
jgi:hypothetical protein